MTPVERSARARVAAVKRHHPHDPKTADLSAKFKADRLSEYIQRVVAEAPPLSDEQKSRLALLLRPTGTS